MLFELDLLAIFQLPSDIDVETPADVHVDELPLYVNVPFTVTDHKVLPDEYSFMSINRTSSSS